MSGATGVAGKAMMRTAREVNDNLGVSLFGRSYCIIVCSFNPIVISYTPIDTSLRVRLAV